MFEQSNIRSTKKDEMFESNIRSKKKDEMFESIKHKIQVMFYLGMIHTYKKKQVFFLFFFLGSFL